VACCNFAYSIVDQCGIVVKFMHNVTKQHQNNYPTYFKHNRSILQHNACASVWELEMFFINEAVSSRDFTFRKNANRDIFYIVHECKTRKPNVNWSCYTDTTCFHGKVSEIFYCLKKKKYSVT